MSNKRRKADVPLNEVPVAHSTLQRMPQELLDKVVSYLDLQSLLQISSALPSLNHISEVIYAASDEFCLDVDKIWPEFWIPVKFERHNRSRHTAQRAYRPNDSANQLIISDKKLEIMGKLSKLLARYGGVAKVLAYSLDYFNAIVAVLPKVIDVYFLKSVGEKNESNGLYCGKDSYKTVLLAIFEAKFKVRNLEVPQDQADDDYLHQEWFQRVTKDVKAIRLFGFPAQPFDALFQYPNLKELKVDLPYVVNKTCFISLMDCIHHHKSLSKVFFEIISFKRYERSALQLVGYYRQTNFQQLNGIRWRCHGAQPDCASTMDDIRYCLVWTKIRLSRKD
ncbi:hypothetical protein BDR26DRAFT_848789, partial [Obelidium mucronatum]